ncbi:hypothetical protein BaRGS_00026926, partial [Batillaria attramentaria]
SSQNTNAGREKRSDDEEPLQAVVETLTQQVASLNAKYSALQAQVDDGSVPEADKVLSIQLADGLSACQQELPLATCLSEFAHDTTITAGPGDAVCRGLRNYLGCLQEVGCACGMLEDGSAGTAELVYNATTMTLLNYDLIACASETGAFIPPKGGIACDAPNGELVVSQLVLSHAESDAVKSLAQECSGVYTCYKTHDLDLAAALQTLNYQQFCSVEAKHFQCLEQAYCDCGLNGTTHVELFLTEEMDFHNQVCGS